MFGPFDCNCNYTDIPQGAQTTEKQMKKNTSLKKLLITLFMKFLQTINKYLEKSNKKLKSFHFWFMTNEKVQF